MSTLDSSASFISGRPVVYRILVVGRLSSSLSERLAEMQIESGEPGASNTSCVTTLVGPLADQAQLAGVLNALFERRLPILLVETLSEESTKSIQLENRGEE